jgi:predicted dehydrogenase
VDDTAAAVVRFKGGALGNLVVSNSQNPALYAQVTVHGDNGASIGVQTDGGAMFVPGLSTITEAPFNHLWTVPGEASHLARWKEEDAAEFRSFDPTLHFHAVQLQDFLQAAMAGRAAAVTAEEGRRTVALAEAIYQATRERRAIRLTP